MYLEKVQAEERLREYEKEMELQELSVRTIHKYLTDIRQWLEKVEETVITKEMIVSYKKELKKKYKAASVNSKIISINRYLRWLWVLRCGSAYRAYTGTKYFRQNDK